MNFRLTFIFLFVFFLTSSSLFARKLFYYASQSSSLGTTFLAGDTIILKNGAWNDKILTFKGNGTADNPIVFMAETAGEVVFTGTSTLSINGNHIIVSGLYFKGKTTTSRNHIVIFEKNANNCRLTNSAIKDYNPPVESAWPSIDKKWISLNGTYNRVDHCYFEGKRNIGALMVVWLENGKSAFHQIDNNHFYKRIPLLDSNNKELNGQETIRIGDSSTSMTFANCIVENNFFEECNGEIEIISNKSCGNIYRNNVFYKNNGMLTLRHGNNCNVYGNYFLGEKVSGSGGVRVVGENHSIYNNYFQDLTGSGYRTAVCLVKGKTNSALNEYFQVKNAQIAFNTFYNCSNVFNIAYQGGNDLAPITSKIAHNVIFATTTSQIGVLISDSRSEIDWKNNLMYQGRFSSFSPTTEQFVRTTNNLNFQSSDETYSIYKPTNQSIIATAYKTNEYSEIQTDIEGKNRSTEKMIGSFELEGTKSISFPTPYTVGCTFINKVATGISTIFNNNKSLVEELRIEGKFFIVNSAENKLMLSIYQPNGMLITKTHSIKNAECHTFSVPINLSGLYILSFDNGEHVQTKKVVISQ